MARERVIEAPPRRDRYFWMLVVTAASMFLGIVLLALDAGAYDWESQPKAAPALSLPKVERQTTPEAKPGPAGPGAPGDGMGQADPKPTAVAVVGK
jgi:hypothetical protein